jgi:hypothetical protein
MSANLKLKNARSASPQPVTSDPFFKGENGNPNPLYEMDAYHLEYRCGLEFEADRAWMGNAVYRDLVQALAMVSSTTSFLRCRMPIVIVVQASKAFFKKGANYSICKSFVCRLASKRPHGSLFGVELR